MQRNVTDTPVQRQGFGVEEVAARLGISAGLVRLEIQRGKLRAAHIGRRLIVSRAAVEEWLVAGERKRRDGDLRAAQER